MSAGDPMNGDPCAFTNHGGDDDLANLQTLNESTILETLKARYMAENISTYVGDILICVNPYQRYDIYNAGVRAPAPCARCCSPRSACRVAPPPLPARAGPAGPAGPAGRLPASHMHQRWHLAICYPAASSQPPALRAAMPPHRACMQIQKFYMAGKHSKEEVAPHPFKVADNAYQRATQLGQSQTVVVGGESGAGKTETAKIILKQIMELAKAGQLDLEQKIKNLTPFREAFGNAKTGMNNNSSRFGNYLEIMFTDTGGVCGAKLRHYLLEKSRVTFRNDGEQTFHIFYMLYAGLASTHSLADFGLSKPSSHKYMNEPPGPPDDTIVGGTLRTWGDDGNVVTEWEEVKTALSQINVSEDTFLAVTKMLASIILIGDTAFTEGGNDDAQISAGNLAKVADMLGVDLANMEAAFITTSTVTRGEKITKNLNKEKAESNRDAVAKGMYEKIFAWIFKSCNDVLVDATAPADPTTIGLLDIFGFEIMRINSLEQMCIDLANEQLQNYFNTHIFVLEQQEYEREGIDVSKVAFKDNQPTLDLFLQKGGLISILDEESKFPKASDLTFTNKCGAALATHPSKAYKPARSDKDLLFSVEHYAGVVEYTSENFLEKNRDTISLDVTQLFEASSEKLLASFYAAPAAAAAPAKGKGKSNKVTLVAAFKKSLAELMERMNASQPQLIRCIKPNREKQPKKWDPELVARQLLYAGVLETIKIRQMGYSFRVPFDAFVRQYKNITYHYNLSLIHI